MDYYQGAIKIKSNDQSKNITVVCQKVFETCTHDTINDSLPYPIAWYSVAFVEYSDGKI